jgi:16S rRNA (cytidine1402-2'-O)-methyltransferase
MSVAHSPGRLVLIPAFLGHDDPALLAPRTLDEVRCLNRFLVENARSARRFLSQLGHPRPIQSLAIVELPHSLDAATVAALLAPIHAGEDCGLLSEAGAPCVADPGAALVAAAHAAGIEVRPLVGPSALLLALMASGLNGQQFRFLGYLPVPAPQRDAAIRSLEAQSRHSGATQMFIETPYRNARLLDALLATCEPGTRLCIAAGLTLPSQWIRTRPVREWRAHPKPPIDGVPAVYLLLAEPAAATVSAAAAPRRRARRG